MKFLTCIIWFHVGPHKDYAVFCLVPSIVKIRASKGGQWSLVWADVERTMRMRCKVAMLVHVPLENRLLTERYVTFVHVAGGISFVLFLAIYHVTWKRNWLCQM